MTEPTLEWLALARGTLDRVAEHRRDDEWVAARWAEPGTQVLVVERGRVLIRSREDPTLILVSPTQAPEGERYLLGVDNGGDGGHRDRDGGVDRDGGLDRYGSRDRVGGGAGGYGAAYFAVSGPLPVIEGAETVDLRRVGALLGDRDSVLFTHALALQNWHATHTHCPRCGGRTDIASAGHTRVCPVDGSEHFPRVDPAVIMLVRDERDRILLARAPVWPERMLSVLAGFVEPGESLEQAVAREVHEEVGLVVGDVRYLGSQPWPLPQSLMLGFFCLAEDGQELRPDPEEIAEARWFTREELCAATESRETLLPGRVSIARQLIERWYGSELPGSWGL